MRILLLTIDFCSKLLRLDVPPFGETIARLTSRRLDDSLSPKAPNVLGRPHWCVRRITSAVDIGLGRDFSIFRPRKTLVSDFPLQMASGTSLILLLTAISSFSFGSVNTHSGRHFK